MAGSVVARLFPPGTRMLRCFTAPEFPSAAPPGWDDPGMRICKQRSRGRATVGNGVFLKEYVYFSRFERWRRRFMAPRPFTALAAARRLEALEVPTPRVLAAARGVAPDGSIRDLLITEELSGVRFGDKAGMAPEALAVALIPVMLRLHAGGFRHGDLSLRNWYLDGGNWGLIDLDGAVLSRRRVSKTWRTRELARLASSCFLAERCDDAHRRDLFALGRIFWERYTAAGGSAYERMFFRRLLALVNRARRKYLGQEDL